MVPCAASATVPARRAATTARITAPRRGRPPWIWPAPGTSSESPAQVTARGPRGGRATAEAAGEAAGGAGSAAGGDGSATDGPAVAPV